MHVIIEPPLRKHNARRVKHDHSKFNASASAWSMRHACPACRDEEHHERRWRGSVDLSRFYAQRMELAGGFPYDSRELAHLFASPADLPRRKARDYCRLSDKQIASKTAKFLTLASEYAERRKGSPLTRPLPTYRQWLGRCMDSATANEADKRAKAEWAAISSHRRVAEVLAGDRPATARRRARILALVCRSNSAGDPADAPLRDFVHLPSNSGHSTWPSYRQQTLDAIYATEGIAGLLSVGAVEEITLKPVAEAA